MSAAISCRSSLRGGLARICLITNISGLGGLFNLTGYHQDEFAGDAYLYGRVGYARRWRHTNGLYGGIMVEAGNAWLPGEARSNASVKSSAALYVGADTGIGPLYFRLWPWRSGGAMRCCTC